MTICRFTEGMEAEQKRKKQKDFLVLSPKKKTSPGWMAQTFWGNTGDSVGRFRRYRCSTLFNYHSNLFMYGTVLQKSIHLPDNRGFLATPQDIYDLNVSAITLSICSFRTPTSIFGTKESCFFLAQPPSPRFTGKFVWTNVRSRRNPIYKAFHRIRLCGNEQNGS